MEGPGGSAAASGATQAQEAPLDERRSSGEGRSPAGSAAELQNALHDLQVRVTELETDYEQARFWNGELEASRDVLAELYDFAPVVYLSLDAQCRILAANLTAATLFGRERGSLVGKFLTGIVAPAQRALLREHVHRCLTEKIRVSDELSFSMRGRPVVTAQVTSVAIVDCDGKAIGCKTIIVDITALKWSQEKLQFLTRASACLGSLDIAASLAQIVRLAVPLFADVAIVDLVRESGELQRLESAFADEVLGNKLRATRAAFPRVHEGTALGRALRGREPLLFVDCTPRSMAAAGASEHDALLKAAGACSVIYVPMSARGDVRGLFTFAATSNSGRQLTQSDLATAADLAARAGMAMENAHLYEQAQRAIAARQDVLSFVSHDLRNPLMGITLTVESMLRTAPEDERRRSGAQLHRVRRAAQQMRRMIEDLLDMSAIEGGRLNVDVATHDAAGLLDEIAEVFGPVATAKRIELEMAPPAAPIGVACDRQRLMQVLSNLIDNAIKFTPEGGRVTVSARGADAKVVFAVQDTGSGIPSSIRPFVFEQFRQARATARQGRGLGLYIAKGLVEAHGGAIWVDSEDGVGTTFSLTMPLAPAGEMGRFGSRDDDDGGKPRRA
jgi:PAS domain S-box-containing protein